MNDTKSIEQIKYDFAAGARMTEKFDVQTARVYASIGVLDGRDLDAHRAELDDTLERAGYVDPSITVTAAPVQ